MQRNIVNRFERKYAINREMEMIICKKIRKVLQLDIYGKNGAYQVNSLYFVTIQSSVNNKHKALPRKAETMASKEETP